MDDEPVMRWTWYHWLAVGIGAGIWILIWYGAGALLYFILSLK